MIEAVGRRNSAKLKRVNTFQASDINRILVWIGSTLVVCINAAALAEIVLGRHGVELVQT